MGAGWDAQSLLEPITADAPCGENLEDTTLMLSFDAFRLFGQPIPLDPVPDWGEVKARSLEALARSKDLRVLAHLAAAVLRTDGLIAFTETLTVAARWLELYWTETFPQVIEDTVLRQSALNCFADRMAVIDGLRRTPLVISRPHGSVTLRELDLAGGELQPREGEARPDQAALSAALAAMPIEELTALHAGAAAGLAALKSLDGTMREAAGSEAAPEFRNLSTELQRLERVLASQTAARTGGSDVPPEAEGSSSQPAAVGAPGVIRSRQDAIRALDAVSEFFRSNEPSSPIPLIVDRAKRLVAKDFLEVLADVAPDALGQARAAGGIRQSE
jgi:type VI secretion system protein ImpA